MKISNLNDQTTWESFNLSFHPASFLQAWSAGEMHARLGKKIFRRGYWVNNELRALALLIKEEARRGTHLLCPGGPVLDWTDRDLAAQVLVDLRLIGCREKAAFIRVRPNLLSSLQAKKVFSRARFIQAPMHLEAETTWELPLQGTENDLLTGMRKGTRLAIKKTIEAGVKIKTSVDPEEAGRLSRLQTETVHRHQFVPFTESYFRAHAKAFLPDNLLFFKAYWQNKLWAIALIVYYGKVAVYHYAASKTSPGGISPPSLILWEAIREARRRQYQVFNLWGVAPTDDQSHRFAGVTRFKQGFGGRRVCYLPAQDLVLSPRYWFIYAFETLRRIRRRL